MHASPTQWKQAFIESQHNDHPYGIVRAREQNAGRNIPLKATMLTARLNRVGAAVLTDTAAGLGVEMD